MTELVIITVFMKNHPVNLLLEKWPSRRDVLDDARAANPDLEMIAVHRWFKRHSVPSGYWDALINGAKSRKLRLKEGDFTKAHAITNEQDGHSGLAIQGGVS